MQHAVPYDGPFSSRCLLTDEICNHFQDNRQAKFETKTLRVQNTRFLDVTSVGRVRTVSTAVYEFKRSKQVSAECNILARSLCYCA